MNFLVLSTKATVREGQLFGRANEITVGTGKKQARAIIVEQAFLAVLLFAVFAALH